MGMEVVWTRLYTIYVGTFVYSFATILGVYLSATFIGSKLYRIWSRRNSSEGTMVLLYVWLAALIPLLTADTRTGIAYWLRVPLGIAAFSALVGYLTPRLVDKFSEGDPNRAGVGYAVNVAGCILGPLVAGFGLLPYLDERYALVTLALPWLLVGVGMTLFGKGGARFPVRRAISSTRNFGNVIDFDSCDAELCAAGAGRPIRRDSTATVIAAGEGMDRRLFVNGVSMTMLTPITKVMSAMPLAFLDHTPQNGLVICLGWNDAPIDAVVGN